MADVNANIGINIDSSDALAQLKALQRQISNFHTSISRSSEAAASAQKSLQRNLINSVNSLGSFSAELRTVRTTAESFTNSLEKNKFSLGEYFRYAGASTKTFGRLFTSEFDTITKVAEDRVKKMQTQYIKMGRDASGAMKAIAIIPNELDMSNLNTQMQMAAQRQALFNQLIKQGSTNLLNFGKNTQWAGRQLMVGFTLPLITLGSTASKVFMDMETAAIKFRKVYGDLFTPAEETEQALKNIKALGAEFTKYGIAAAKTIDLAAQAAAAGFQGVDLQRQVEQANRLAVLGQVEQQQALETTISLQNAFKMSSADLAEQINFLNIVENQTVTSLEDITIAIPKVAPVIQQLGGDVKDLAFFLTAMREGGINASEGANALKSGLGSLINPTKKAADMLASMGININNIVEKNKGDLRATVVEFAKALEQLDPLARARAIEQLFGKFQFARLSTLFSNVARDGTQASRVLDIAGESASSLAMIAEKELGITANSAMNKFRKAVEDLKIAVAPVGEIFLQVVTPLLNTITSILDKFNGLSEGTQKAIARLVIVIGGIGPVAIMTFGLLLNGLANIIKFAQLLRNGYLRLTGQSKILTDQTGYLTAEQLEAAAVASSLEQSHATLTQQFNVEAGAVEKLRAAYERANTAGRNFAAANPGMMLPGKGRRPIRRNMGGQISGPGTKTSDSIPALLSDGEYVVRASAVDKYGVDFFNAINAKKFRFGGLAGSSPLSFLASTLLVSGLRKVGFRSTRAGKQPGAIDYNQMSLRKGRNRVWMENPILAQGKPKRGEEVVGHIFSNAFYKQFGGTSGGSAPRKTSSFLESLGIKVKNKDAMYDVLPNQFMTIPSDFNTSLTYGRANTSQWFSNPRKPEHLTSVIAYAMSRGATPEQAMLIASRVLDRVNSNIFRLSGTGISEKMFGNIVTNASRKEFKIFGFNKGVAKVPGSGNKDKVPALLTPGESVIPKEMTQKYGALIDGMIAGNIPGFNNGILGLGKKNYGRRKNKALGGVPAPLGVNRAHPEGLFNFLDLSSADDISVMSMAMQDIVKQTPGASLEGAKKEIAAWREQNLNLLRQANEKALQGADLDEAFIDVRKKFNDDMEKLGGNTHKLRMSAEKSMPKLKKDFEAAQAHARKMGLDVRKASDMSRLMKDLPGNVVTQQMGTRGKFQSYNPLRSAGVSAMGGSFTQYGLPAFFVIDEFKDALSDLTLSTEHVSTTMETQAAAMTKTEKKQEKSSSKRTRARNAKRRAAAASGGSDVPPTGPVVIGNVGDGDNPSGDGKGKPGLLSRFKASKLKFNPMSLFVIPTLLPILDLIPKKLAGIDTSIGKTAAKFALMGSAFGPKGILIGGIVGVGKAIYDKITKPTEEAIRITEALKDGLASSETVATLFGGEVGGTIEDFKMIPPALDEVTEKLAKSIQKAQEFKNIVDQLDADNPLKKFVDGLKGLSGKQLTGLVRTFVSTQIASGALPVKEAEDFTRGLLTAAGAANQFDQVWKSIRASVATEAKAIDTQFKKLAQSYVNSSRMNEEDTQKLEKLTRRRDELLSKPVKTRAESEELYQLNKQIEDLTNKYKGGKTAAINYGNAMITFFSNISTGRLSLKQIQTGFKAIADSGLTATERLNAYRQAVVASGNEEAIANLKANKTFLDQIAASALAAEDQMYATLAAQAMGAALQQELDKVDGSSFKDRMMRASMLGRKYANLAISTAKLLNPDPPTGTGGGGTKNKNLTLLEKEIEALKKKADAQKKVNDELKRQNDYVMKQMDLSRSMAEAKISGDYLGAAIIGQQKRFGAAEFNAESADLNMQARIDYLETIAQKIENKQPLSVGEKATMSQIKAGKTTAMPANIQMKYPTVSPISTFSGSNYQTSRFGISANQPSYSPAGASGGVYNTITMNITGSNPEEIANKVIKKLNLVQAKNGTSNNISSGGSANNWKVK